MKGTSRDKLSTELHYEYNLPRTLRHAERKARTYHSRSVPSRGFNLSIRPACQPLLVSNQASKSSVVDRITGCRSCSQENDGDAAVVTMVNVHILAVTPETNTFSGSATDNWRCFTFKKDGVIKAREDHKLTVLATHEVWQPILAFFQPFKVTAPEQGIC